MGHRDRPAWKRAKATIDRIRQEVENHRWNPRFLAYCRSQGNTPEAQLSVDDARYPGGKMCGFILWLHAQWKEFYTLKGWDRDRIKGEEDHREFDAWLEKTSVKSLTNPKSLLQ